MKNCKYNNIKYVTVKFYLLQLQPLLVPSSFLNTKCNVTNLEKKNNVGHLRREETETEREGKKKDKNNISHTISIFLWLWRF